MNLALTETCQLVRSRGPGEYRGSIGPPDACVIRRCRRLAALSRLCLEAIAAGRSNGRIRVQDILQQAQQYLVLVINKDNAHYDMATILGRRHWRLGVPVIITTTVVSTAIFSTLTEETAMGWRIATGLISVAAAVLAALQTFFGFADQAQRHVETARGYSALRRRIERFLLRYRSEAAGREQALKELEMLTHELDKLEAIGPPIDEKIYTRVRDRMKAERSSDAAGEVKVVGAD
jgi:hypothetical protein